jgi:colicin import membrane protein
MSDANLAAPPPESEQSSPTALLLSALVHLLLIGALFLGVQWKSQSPASVAVEVWRAAPAAAVVKPEPAPEPPKPEPAPEPRPEPKPEPKPTPKAEPAPTIKPDIAIKDEKKPKKEEPKKPETKKEDPKKPEPKKEEPKEPKKPEPKKPEPDRRASLDDELKRDLKQAQQQKTAQDQRARADAEASLLAQLKGEQAAAGRSRGLDDWSNKVKNKIRNNIVVPPSVLGNPEAIFGITQLPSGEIIDVKLRKSSGNQTLDAAIERAIMKSTPLPKPDQQELYQRVFELKVKPLAE